MSTLASRLRRIRDDLGLNQVEFGSRVGASKQTVSQWEDGTIRSLKAGTLLKIEEVSGYSARWISTGKGHPKAGAENTSSGPELGSVPLVSWVRAGQWSEVEDMHRVGEGEKPIYTTIKVGPRAYALRVEGDSMENPSGRPTFPQDCIIIVDPDLQPKHDSCVIVRLEDTQEATFKQLKVEGGKRYLKPLNPRYPVLEVNKKASFCGVVVQTIIDNQP